MLTIYLLDERLQDLGTLDFRHKSLFDIILPKAQLFFQFFFRKHSPGLTLSVIFFMNN